MPISDVIDGFGWSFVKQYDKRMDGRSAVLGLRRQCEAILIGGETLRRDNPHLTLRGPQAEGRPQPLRVVLTSQKDLPQESHLFTDKFVQRTRVHSEISLEESLRRLQALPTPTA